MAAMSDRPNQRPCRCGGTNPNCLQCGGKGVIDVPAVRPIMAGPAGIRRRLPVSRESAGTVAGPPEPVRCPHCGLEVLLLAVHVAEAHPDKPQHETTAEREAREQEEARQAVVAAEIARREAEAAQRKAEARARRQAIEGPQAAITWPGRAQDTSPRQPPKPAGAESPRADPPDEAWERLRQALAERTTLTGVVRSRGPVGLIVALGGIEGILRWRELRAEDTGREAPGLREGQAVQVRVIGMSDDTRRVELSMRQAGAPRNPSTERSGAGASARPAEGPMALAFRLAREKKKQVE